MVLHLDDQVKVEINNGVMLLSVAGEPVLKSPEAGHWQIACGFEANRPVNWCSSKISNIESLPGGFVLSGTVSLPDGELKVRDCCFQEGSRLKVVRRWEYSGKTLPQAMLSVKFDMPGCARLLLPGILYYGNPSGEKNSNVQTGFEAPSSSLDVGEKSGKVPVLPQTPGSRGFFEEHRFPMPMITGECENRFAALHFLPSPAASANRPDLWWSAGAEYGENTTQLALYSGFVSGNGVDGQVKALQDRWLAYPDACVCLTDALVVEKTFFLQCGSCRPGCGFIPGLKSELDYWQVPVLPIDLNRAIEKKYHYALSRFYQNGKVAGSLFTPNGIHGEKIVFGWCGRSETLGYAGRILGEKYGDVSARKRGDDCFDFMIQSPVNEDGFCVEYDIPTGVWSDRNFISQGQALETFSASLLERKHAGEELKPEYLDFLSRTADVLANRILRPDWYPVSTNEGFLGIPLGNAYQLLGNEKFLTALLKLADHYIRRHSDMSEPYWGGTLDACCEDKEGAYAAMCTYFAAWENTGKAGYLEAAEHALMVYLTYLQCWTIPMPPGRLADNGFNSCGWTAVSVQNMHLDVFGVFVTPLLWKLGAALDLPAVKALALPMLVNCAQLFDPYGSQGEQVQQTNYAQRPPFEPVEALRGGYAETWTVFWITACFLNAAAQLQSLGAINLPGTER